MLELLLTTGSHVVQWVMTEDMWLVFTKNVLTFAYTQCGSIQRRILPLNMVIHMELKCAENSFALLKTFIKITSLQGKCTSGDVRRKCNRYSKAQPGLLALTTASQRFCLIKKHPGVCKRVVGASAHPGSLTY